MTTAAERLVSLSGLLGVSAAQHLISIKLSGVISGAMLVSRSTLSSATAAEHLLDRGVSDASGEIVLKNRWYVRRKKKIMVFDSAAHADAYLKSEAIAEQAVESAQKTSRLARKRIRSRVVVDPIDSVDTGALQSLIRHFAIQVDLPTLLAKQDYERVIQIWAQAMILQDEEDMEILLLL